MSGQPPPADWPQSVPSLSGLPWLGSFPAFTWDPTGFMKRAAERYGEIVHFKLVSEDVYLLSSPELARRFLVQEASRASMAGSRVAATDAGPTR